MATAMLEGGADVRFIQAMLGHADLRATEIYTQVSIRKLKDVHTATHPAALLLRRHDDRGEDSGDGVEARETLLDALDAEAHEDDDEPDGGSSTGPGSAP